MEINQKKFQDSDLNVSDTNQKHAIDVDIIESNEALILYLDLPGFEISDIHMSVNEQGVLKIKAQRKYDFLPLESALLSERMMGEFYKEVILPNGLDFENPNSSLQNGVLKLVIAKL